MTKKSNSSQKDSKKRIVFLEKKVEEYKNREDFTKAISVESLENFDSLKIDRNPKLKEETIAIACISDVHAEEEVIKSVVSGLNTYNLQIAEERVERFFKRLLYMIRQNRKAGYKIESLVLALLGDFISGYIHEELEETNQLTPPQATLFIQKLLIKGIKTVAEEGNFKEILIPCIPGNHGRTTKRKRFSSGYRNSYEWLMYNNIADLFKQDPKYDNIKFIIAEGEFIYLNLFGYINMFSHGDHFNYQGGIGGIEVPLKKWILRENSVVSTGVDMAWIAHWHQYIVSNKVRVNGSVIGYNGYARSFGFAPEPPKMQFQLLDKRRGYTLNNPIYLTDFSDDRKY
jgi:hypothetical protein